MTVRCPKCNADLYARPPRSYAEMEGLVEVGPDPSLQIWSRPEPNVRQGVTGALRRARKPHMGPATSAALFLASAIGCAAAIFLLF